ncbi:hypothetical protein LX32DRAFT_455786 [Colletotrichum zoysiae]|uniref:Uncharacterized protein n=1 Tax=Colletotrichum zoysiae TaxID=1216348 RepID=A0AAD9M348_9PEZI|nr:hypothetical protein LX32DRAFT_455786 [Colletotrichum zoysiae]
MAQYLFVGMYPSARSRESLHVGTRDWGFRSRRGGPVKNTASPVVCWLAWQAAALLAGLLLGTKAKKMAGKRMYSRGSNKGPPMTATSCTIEAPNHIVRYARCYYTRTPSIATTTISRVFLIPRCTSLHPPTSAPPSPHSPPCKLLQRGAPCPSPQAGAPASVCGWVFTPSYLVQIVRSSWQR